MRHLKTPQGPLIQGHLLSQHLDRPVTLSTLVGEYVVPGIFVMNNIIVILRLFCGIDTMHEYPFKEKLTFNSEGYSDIGSGL